jgi:(1->4)-alpha-D-glucan 1-alpha-D-glucosylmutase
LRELLACFPVYRSYARPPHNELRDADKRVIDAATAAAKSQRPDVDPELFDFLNAILTLRIRGDLERTFVQRFQQLSTAAMAKGVEDTAFYTYNRFVALNEVGGDPGKFGVTPQEFHERLERTQTRHPQTLLATATHDSKRGEDVRARLAVLTECPAAWISAVRQWAAHNERHRTRGSEASGALPDRNAEYLFYQIAVGAWPLTPDRAVQYMEKASREAKTHTSWTAPREEYDGALRSFVERSLADAEFTGSVRRFVDSIIAAGREVSLAQTLIKLTAPGIPDIYQGTELWSLTLVDPDNRHAVDFKPRRDLLEAARTANAAQAMAAPRVDEGLPKIWLIHRVLAVRAAHPRVFGPDGCYRAITATGTHAERVVAFARGEQVVTVVPRLMRGLRGDWHDTDVPLPDGRWRNVLTDEQHSGRAPVAALFARFPVAMLLREPQ